VIFNTTDKFLKMFGYASLSDLPELPRYKLDENQQIVIDDLIQNEETDQNIETDQNAETEKDEVIKEAPEPEREEENQ